MQLLQQEKEAIYVHYSGKLQEATIGLASASGETTRQTYLSMIKSIVARLDELIHNA